MDLRTKACFAISRRMMKPAPARMTDYSAYERWRHESLSNAWKGFDDSQISDRDVLDFGCGDGQLSLFLAKTKHPRRIVGVDIDGRAIERAAEAASHSHHPTDVVVEFIRGTPNTIPVPDQSFDVVVAFACMEHIMSPVAIMREWGRVLRPGGRCLIGWVPYKGPWGPHMESLIPIPWAHVLFGERAMFRTAEMIYDLPEFQPRHWDVDSSGNKKPNKWRVWSSFAEQDFINQLDMSKFKAIAAESHLKIARVKKRGVAGSSMFHPVVRMMVSIPFVGEYFTSSYNIELERVI